MRKPDRLGHLLFNTIFSERLDGLRSAHIAEGVAAGLAIRAAEVEVDRHAEERLAIARFHVVLVLEVGGFHCVTSNA